MTIGVTLTVSSVDLVTNSNNAIKGIHTLGINDAILPLGGISSIQPRVLLLGRQTADDGE